MTRTVGPARYRLRITQQVAEIEVALTHGIKPTIRQFGLDRKTIRRWRDASRGAGLGGLVPRYPARRAPRWSPKVRA